MIRVLNIMVSSINISWMLAENWIRMARLLNKHIAWNSYRLSDWSLLILSQSRAIVCPLNLCLLSTPSPRLCIKYSPRYFPLIFFKKFLAYLSIKYMTVGHHKSFLKVVQKGFHYLVYESPSKLSRPKPDTRIYDHDRHANIKPKSDINKNQLNFNKLLQKLSSFFSFLFLYLNDITFYLIFRASTLYLKG